MTSCESPNWNKERFKRAFRLKKRLRNAAWSLIQSSTPDGKVSMVSSDRVGNAARLRFSPVPSSAVVFRIGNSRLGERMQAKKTAIMIGVRFIG